MDGLIRPWVLTRLVVALSATALLAYAMPTAILAWNARGKDSKSTSLARRSELMSTVVASSAWLYFGVLALTVIGADRMAHDIEGAMCGWGVLTATPYGLASLYTAIALVLSSAAWLALHRFDLSMKREVLTRPKLMAGLVLLVVALLDLRFFISHGLGLNLEVTTSCCASTSGGAIDQVFGSTASSSSSLAMGALGLGVLGFVLCVALTRAPGRALALTSAVVVAAAVGLGVIVAVGFVAPHVYETPVHRCPFCLFHWDSYGAGYLLFGGLLLAGGSGLGMLPVGALMGFDDDAARKVLRRLGALTSSGLLLALSAGVIPVAVYYFRTGTTVFGGLP